MLVNIHFSKYHFGNPRCSFKKSGLSTTYMCITLFCTLLCRQCTTTMWKCLIPRFVEGENTRKWLFFSFPELFWYTVKNLNPRKNNLLTFDALNKIVSALKFEAVRIHFLSDVFVAVAIVVAYKLPFFEWLERGVKLLQVLHLFWLMSYRYLFFSSQIWYLRKQLFTSIRQSKDMRVKGFNFLLVYVLVPCV